MKMGPKILISLALISLATLLLSANYYPLEITIFLGVLALLVFFSFYPLGAFYLAVFCLPFINWNISLGPLYFSVAEAVGIIALISWFLNYLFSPQKEKLKWPLIWPFAFFVLAGLVSAFFSFNPLASAYYELRWVLFLYLIYVFLPFNIIKSRLILTRVLIFLTGAVSLMAVFGFSSLFFQDWSNSFLRVQPWPIFGFFPYGYNHNLLAEFLLLGAFLPLALKYFFPSQKFSRLANVLAIVLALCSLATFSRAAWLSLAVGGLTWLLLLIINKEIGKNLVRGIVASAFVVALFLSPVFFQMFDLQAVNKSSTASRWLLTQISLEAFEAKPLVGHGPGNFIFLVEDHVRFRAKYGDPLDSHGLGQKVLAEKGSLGIISLFLILIAVYLQSYRGLINNPKLSKLFYPLISSSVTALFFQFFNTSYYKGKMWLPLILPLIVISVLGQKKYGGKK